jgi:hypothetical protein
MCASARTVPSAVTALDLPGGRTSNSVSAQATNLSPMPDYAVYGGCLRSTVPIPELRPLDPAANANRTWLFEVGAGDAPSLDATVIGTEQLFDDVTASFSRAAETLRLSFDDTGIFDLLESASRIIWYPRPGHEPNVARADLVGRVLPLAEHERGLLALHASAVALHGEVLAFMAPKNYGKSTLAMTMVARHGARLLTDDTLIVEPETGLAVPGVHSVRLWAEMAERFRAFGSTRPVLSDKLIFEEIPQDALEFETTPTAALYTLRPQAADQPVTIDRRPLDAIEATIAIIQYQKLGALLAGPEAAKVFANAAALAARVAVYELHIARDLARLPEAGERIASWHAHS